MEDGQSQRSASEGTSWNLSEMEEGHGQDQVVAGEGVVALPFPTWHFMSQRAIDICLFSEFFFLASSHVVFPP